MRAFVFPGMPSPGQPSSGPSSPSQPSPGAPSSALPAFLPFDAQAFVLAYRRHVPVFLVIGDLPDALCEPSLASQIAERTVPVHLLPGMRPDVELLCQRAGALYSDEGALPLCALLLENGCPFLAAPLPPPGYPLDPARLFVWLAHADRRFAQNLPAFQQQAAGVMRSLRAEPLHRPYAPKDAAHDLLRALTASEDARSGGFGGIKAPLVPALRFLLHESGRGSRDAHRMLTRALDAMLSSALYDPLDGGFFAATLTDDWRAFVPEKPLVVNALLALTLLETGRRAEAVRTLDFIVDSFSLEGGALTPALRAPLSTYAFTPEQACAALGSEEGLRACRLLNLLRQHARAMPALAPSRFSPPVQDAPAGRRAADAPLCPTLSRSLTPEDAAFLRRVTPKLLRARAARIPQRPVPQLLSEDCALGAWVLAVCGRRLGEAKYAQAAQRAAGALLRTCPPGQGGATLPPACASADALHRTPSCGAAAALALLLLELGQTPELGSYGESGLRVLGAALHAFVTRDAQVLHTAQDAAAVLPRVPAWWDGEKPAPAALLVHALRLAHALRPEAGYARAMEDIWNAAAPHVKASPMACAGMIDAMRS